MVDGCAMNAATAAVYSSALGELDLTECLAALVEQIRNVQAGDLSGAEAMLTAQAVALNAMFTQLAHRASKMTIVDQLDRLTRLALKAQGQCRATLETLAAIKNPPMVFARQANISQGPQQVNNNPTVTQGNRHDAATRAHAGSSEIEQLLEPVYEAELVPPAPSASGTRDHKLATVAVLHRSTNRGR
jgi:hypothetical protein